MKYFIYVRKSTEEDSKQVNSIESQLEALEAIALKNKLTIVGIYQENKSSKDPFIRNQYTKMIARVKNGEANALLTWNLNRLSRNPIEGSELIWLLQKHVLKEILTPHARYQSEDNVLPLYLEFGMSNQFIVNLKRDVKRGMVKKCEQGHPPFVPPVGYVNNPYGIKGEKTIIPDTERFSQVRKIWDMLLSEQYTVKQILAFCHNTLKLKTVRTKNEHITLALLYNIFNNPFYYGSFWYDGILYKGKYTPMITREEYETAKQILNRKTKSKEAKHSFEFTGLIRCAECDSIITADGNKKKRLKNGTIKHYEYYYCGKKKGPCSQRAVQKHIITTSIDDFLDKVNISDAFLKQGSLYIKQLHEHESENTSLVLEKSNDMLLKVKNELDSLLDLKIRSIVSDEEYLHKKTTLLSKKEECENLIHNICDRQNQWMKKVENLLVFCRNVVVSYEKGSITSKKLILRSICSNLALKDRQPIITPHLPFQMVINSNLLERSILSEFEPLESAVNTEEMRSIQRLNIHWFPDKESNLD